MDCPGDPPCPTTANMRPVSKIQMCENLGGPEMTLGGGGTLTESSKGKMVVGDPPFFKVQAHDSERFTERSPELQKVEKESRIISHK